MVRAEGRAVRAELLVRPGRHGPARPERRRQDHADAGHHRPHPGQPGPGPRRRPLAPRATARSTGSLALVPEDEAVPRGLTPRQLCTYVADLHGITDRSVVDWALRTVEMEPVGRPQHGRLQQGHAPAQQGGGRPREEPARARARRAAQRRRPGAAAPPHRAVPAARRRGPHGHRELARAQRGRVDGRPGDRDRAGPPRRRRAATGPSATRWTTCPATCSCGPPAAGGWRPRSLGNDVVSGITVDGDDLIISTTRAKELAVLLPRRPPATSACTSPRSARSTTRSRASSGSWSDDAATTTRPTPARAARPGRLHAARPACPAGAGSAALIPAGAAVLFGFIASTVDETAVRAFAGVAAIALFGLVMPVTCLVIGDAVLGAEVRSGIVHLHLDVAGARPGRSRSAAGSAARSPRPAAWRSPSRSPPSWPAPPRAPARSPSRPCFGRRPTSPSSSPSAASPSGPRCGRSPSSSSSSGCSAPPSRGIAQLSPVVGGPGRLRRPHRRPRGPRPRGHPPRHRRPRPPLRHHGRRPRPHQHRLRPSSSPAARLASGQAAASATQASSRPPAPAVRPQPAVTRSGTRHLGPQFAAGTSAAVRRRGTSALGSTAAPLAAGEHGADDDEADADDGEGGDVVVLEDDAEHERHARDQVGDERGPGGARPGSRGCP